MSNRQSTFRRTSLERVAPPRRVVGVVVILTTVVVVSFPLVPTLGFSNEMRPDEHAPEHPFARRRIIGFVFVSTPRKSARQPPLHVIQNIPRQRRVFPSTRRYERARRSRACGASSFVDGDVDDAASRARRCVARRFLPLLHE